MKLIFAIFAFVLSITASFTQNSLTLEVSGFKSKKGQVFVALYNQEGHFLSETDFYRQSISPVDQDTMLIQFSDLPSGDYAVSVFHDANDNGQLDTNFLGAPKESYGFSNNPKIWFRAPTFAEARIEVKTNIKQSIHLK